MFKCAISLLLLSASCLAHAAPVIDQESIPSSPSVQTIAAFGYTPVYAQSFRPLAANVAGGGVLLANLPDPVTLGLALYDALPQQGGARLASGVARDAVGWAEAFWAPVTIDADRTYFLVLEVPAEWTSFIGGHYADGQAFRSLPDDPTLTPIGDLDFVFRTYADVTAVPEPGSIALIGVAAVAALGSVRRRRRNGRQASALR